MPANLNGPWVFPLKDTASKHAKYYLEKGAVSLWQKSTHGAACPPPWFLRSCTTWKSTSGKNICHSESQVPFLQYYGGRADKAFNSRLQMRADRGLSRNHTKCMILIIV